MTFQDIDTPALLIDKSKLLNNIQRMSDLAQSSGVDFRPHIKTHKMPYIAEIQKKFGAIGIASAKVSEAKVFAEYGFKDIRIANIIVGRHKIERLFKLYQICDHLSVCVDSFENSKELSDYFVQHEAKLEVLIEINVGMDRSGVKEDADILDLAAKIKDLKGIKLIGILTHAGQSYNADTYDEIVEIGKMEGERMVEITDMLRASSIPIEVISVGSTPTVPYSAKVKGVTEIRPGNFVFFDVIQYALGSCELEDCALSVLARVVSKPDENRAVIDAGKKALSADASVFPGDVTNSFGYVVETGSRIARLSEEHGVIIDDKANLKVGDLIRVIPSHACTTTNQFDHAYLISNNEIEKKIEISARGKFY